MAAAGVYHEELEALRHQSGCAAALIALAICFAVPRLIAQSLRNSQLAVHSWDVGLILASAIVFITLCAFAIVNAQAYSAFYEAHDKATKGHHYVTVFKTSYAISVIYPLASAIPKLSLCAFYLQVMGVNTWVRRITNSTGAFLVANAVAWLVPTIIVCRPISVFWSLEGHQGKCLNYNVFGTWISLPNIITDLVLLILPMPVLWKTQISILRKLGLMAIFAVGCAGTIGACFRMAFYIHRTYVERQGTKQTTRSIVLSMIVTLLECGLYLIAVCMPSLRIVFVQLHKSLSNSISYLLQKRRAHQPNSDSSPSDTKDSEVDSGKILADRIFVKLTNIGKLSTLRRASNDIGSSGIESGFWHGFTYLVAFVAFLRTSA